jgi:hypothetical protein
MIHLGGAVWNPSRAHTITGERVWPSRHTTWGILYVNAAEKF